MTSTDRLELDGRDVSVPIEAGISEHTPLIQTSSDPVKSADDAAVMFGDKDAPPGLRAGYQQDAKDPPPGLPDEPPAIKPHQTTNRLSIWVMIFISFLSNFVFSIVIPSLPHFIQEVGAKAYMNGWAVPLFILINSLLFLSVCYKVAANSAGTFLAAPVLGYWSDKRGVKEVIIWTTFLIAGANVWYALCKDIYQIVAARFLVGLAAGNSAAATSFLSYATSQKERASILTINMASAVLGFIAGPGFSAVTSLPQLEFQWEVKGYVFKFNQDTYPGYVSALFALFALPCMIPFKSVRPPKNKDEVKPSFWTYFDKSKGGANLVGVLVIYLSVFLFTIAFTIFETSGPNYVAEDPYIRFTTFYTSLMFGALAIVALLSIVVLRVIMKFFKNERIILACFGSLVSIGLFIIFCWEDPFHGWVSMPRFLVGVFFIAFGFTVNQSLTTVVFSKILDGLEQGVLLGWMWSISSVARFISPIVATLVWGSAGPNWVLLIAAVSTLISNVAIAVFYKSLRPRVVDDITTINHDTK